MPENTAVLRIRRLRSVSCLLAAVFLFQSAPVPLFPGGKAIAAAVDAGVQSQSYILMDGDTGQILLERDMDSVRKPASITKIMTALLALEKGSLSDPVTVSQDAADIPGDASSIGLTAGEILPLKELLYAVMLESANEGANAAAEYVSGTMADFAALMTRRAKELGAKNTNFTNANGLNDDNHYTSAYDMALITKEAIKTPAFLEIWGSYQHILEPTNIQPESRILNNNNRLLLQGPMPYEGILGGKTGFTAASQNTLVEAARRGDRTLICVLLQAPGALASFQDAVLLLDYGFNQFRSETFTDAEYQDSYSFLLHNDLTAEQVTVTYGQSVKNDDGSDSVSVVFRLPESGGLMYPEIGADTFVSPAPPPEPERKPLLSPAGIWGVLILLFGLIVKLVSLIAVPVGKLLALIGLLPGWLAFIVRLLLGVFSLLLVLACFFRTRRYLRRRRRRINKQKMEARRKAYRERQSYWG